MSNLLAKLRELTKKSPHLAFIGALVLLVLVSAGIAGVSRHKARPNVLPAQRQPAQQAQQFVPAQQQAQQNALQAQQSAPAQQQGAKQEHKPVAEATSNYLGIPILRQGTASVMAGRVRPLSSPEKDWNKWPEGLSIGCADPAPKKYTPEEAPGKVVFLTGGKNVSFDLAVEYFADFYPLDSFAYCTHLKISADGKPVKELDITKDSLLVNSIPVRIEGAQQVTLDFSTSGKKTKDERGNEKVQDEKGCWLPVVLTNFKVEPPAGQQ
jgi:hypothetical protein